MTTYDVHQHLWPEVFIDALRTRGTPPFIDGDELVTREGRFVVDPDDHSLVARLDVLDRDEIGVAVISLQTSLGLEALAVDDRHTLEETWAKGARDLVADAGGRLLAFSPSIVRDGFVGISIGSSELWTSPSPRRCWTTPKHPQPLSSSTRMQGAHRDPSGRSGGTG